MVGLEIVSVVNGVVIDRSKIAHAGSIGSNEKQIRQGRDIAIPDRRLQQKDNALGWQELE